MKGLVLLLFELRATQTKDGWTAGMQDEKIKYICYHTVSRSLTIVTS